MAAIDERNVSRFLFNPFSVYIAAVGDSQPSEPSYYTDPGMTFSFNKEFVAAMGYKAGSGVMYTVRQDLRSFDFRVSFSIKESTPNSLKIAHGGTIDSDSETLILDGSVTSRAFWFESCFNDDSKIIRVTIPTGKNVESSEFTTGSEHAMHNVNIQALPDIDDNATLPTIYIDT